MLHQEDEPGDLPIKLTGLGVTVAEFGLTCAWFSGGKAKIFPVKVSLIVVSQTDLLKSSSKVTAMLQAKRTTKREAIFKDAKLTGVSSKGVS